VSPAASVTFSGATSVTATFAGTVIVWSRPDIWTTKVVPLPFCTVPFVMRECDAAGREREPFVILLG